MRQAVPYSLRAVCALCAGALLVACGDDDNEGTQRFRVTLENVGTPYTYFESGVFDTPVGDATAGPATPGKRFEFTVHAGIGHKLSFATMFGQSNDLFYAPDGGGIDLYDENDDPITGDVTDQIYLWDAGTEANQEPGAGPDQAPREAAPNTGAADPNNLVRLATDDFGNLPDVSEVLAVSIAFTDGDTFTVTIENVSDATTLVYTGGSAAAPNSPGVWVVTSADDPLFTAGEPDRGDGLEQLAEDGDPSALGASVAADTGLTTPIAPGVWVVDAAMNVLFVEAQPDPGDGLEHLAEDADPTALAASLADLNSGVFTTPVGASAPGPIQPGQSFTFEIQGRSGDRLFFASMFGQSNDLFFGPNGMGISLFDSAGAPVSGDVTPMIALWDAGTEVNQRPGTGSDQAPRQVAPNTGADEHGVVQVVNDGFTYPAVSDLLKVTIEPISQ